MKKLLFILFVTTNLAYGSTGWYNDYIIISANGSASTFYWIGGDPGYGTQLNGNAFGVLNTFIITGADLRYWSDTQDRLGGAFYYKIMSSDGNTEVIAAQEIIWTQSSLGGNDYQGLITVSINLLTGLAPGTSYQLHIWAKSWGSNQGDSWLSNSGANYVATFTTSSSYYFSGSGVWSDAANWNLGIPTASSNVVINGAATINGEVTINDLTINLTKSLTINPGKSLTVTGSITNSAGDGGLVIESDATGTGSLINNSENVNATVKQYVTPVTTWGVTQDGWHFLSSPVASQSISGSFIPVSSYDFFSFDEPTYTWINKKAHPEMTAFGVGKGYLVSYALVDTKAFTGILNRGDVSVPVTLTTSLPDNQEGWNLVGNPFCSSIDWDGVTRTGVAADAFYIRNAANNGWSSYIAGVATNYNSDGNIPPMQGIFVRATSNGNITIPSTARLHSTQDFTKAATTLPDNIVKLRAIANNQSDETVLRLNNEATTGFDNSWDANKFISANGAIPQIYSKLNEVSYSINSVEVPEEELIIPVYVQVGEESDVELIQQDNTLLPELGYAIEDLKTGNRIVLSTGSYFFHASPDDDAHRFNLRLGLKTSLPETASAIEVLTIHSSGSTVYLNSKSTLDAHISIHNFTGQEIYQSNMKLDGLKQISINAPTGWYIVKLVTASGVKSEKIFIN